MRRLLIRVVIVGWLALGLLGVPTAEAQSGVKMEWPGTPSPKDMEDGIKSLNLPVEFLNPEVGREYTFAK